MEQHYILLPIHLEEERHWALGGILLIKNSPTMVLYLDSLLDSCPIWVEQVLMKAAQCFSPANVAQLYTPMAAKQNNFRDCGVHLVAFAEQLLSHLASFENY